MALKFFQGAASGRRCAGNCISCTRPFASPVSEMMGRDEPLRVRQRLAVTNPDEALPASKRGAGCEVFLSLVAVFNAAQATSGKSTCK